MWVTTMIRIQLVYSDNKTVIKEFETAKEMAWYVYNEGDHLISYAVIDDDRSGQ